MKRVEYNPEALLNAGCVVRTVGPDRMLILPGGDHVRVRVDGEDLILFPERSAAHKKLLGFLGYGQ